MEKTIAPAVVRGEIIERDLVKFGGRDGAAAFFVPDPESLLERLPLRDPSKLRDLYTLKFNDILDYLAELGEKLSLRTNVLVQQALEQSYALSDMTPPLLRASYAQLPYFFRREVVTEVVEQSIGLEKLDGWGEVKLRDGRVAAIRAMGARALHIIAGNAPAISALTVVRNAITRSDAIIKLPSNDPLTGLAIVRTMAEMAPDHPITKHISCAYWKGGDEAFEQRLYQPSNIEKILAWGGLASVKHVTRYIQPGLELISLDPKRSATVIGSEAFADEKTLREVALRAASDIGAVNQLACLNARVIYVACGTDKAGLAKAERLGRLIYEAIQGLPESLSTRAKHFDPELRADIKALRMDSDFYTVIGAESDEGGVIVSHMDEPVDFYTSLSGRVANLIPITDPLDAVRGMNAYTQTVGVYPESLKRQLRDILPLYGAQRIVSLGYAVKGSTALPQDAIEPIRRMVKWIVDESCDPAEIAPPWEGVLMGDVETAAV